MRSFIIVGLVLASGGFAAAACSSNVAGAPTSGAADAISPATDTGMPLVESVPTYYQDIAPLYVRSCVGCHQAGGIAPFALDSYESAKSHALESSDEVARNRMPPYDVDSSGACGEFAGVLTLSAEQKAKLAKWVEAGTPPGERPLISPTPAPVPTLVGGVDYMLPKFSPVREGGPLAEFDEYRCFAMPANQAGKFITGYDVKVDNTKVLHHVIGTLVDPNAPSRVSGKTNAQQMAALHAQTPARDGWPCFTDAGEGVAVTGAPVNWAPGQGVTEYPAGMGMGVGAGDVLVFQVHYNLADDASLGSTDQSTIALRFATSVERRIVFSLKDKFLESAFFGASMSIPAGQEAASITWKARVSELGLPSAPYVDLVQTMFHMHQRGTKQTISITQPGAAKQCIARTEHFDFHWQRFYTHKEPIRLTRQSLIDVECVYNTKYETQAVTPGWGTRNEMCLSGMMLALPPGM